MAFQLCVRDEYHQNTIVEGSTDDLPVLMKRVTDDLIERNEANALTVDYKNANWEAYLPLFFNGEGDAAVVSDDVLYGGLNTRGEHIVYVRQDENSEFEPISLDKVAAPYRLFLGVLDDKAWYARDERGNLVQDINHRVTEGRDTYFFRNPQDRL